MKKKDTVLLLGILSILILVSVQFFIINGIWKQKDEMFLLRYTLRSQEALKYLNRRMDGDGFDTVRYILRGYSEKANREIHKIHDSVELAARKKEIFDFFTQVVNREQDLSDMLAAYFQSRGFEKKFKTTIVINSLEMIGADTIVVYHSKDFIDRRPDETGTQPKNGISRSKILVKWFGWEDDNYKFSFAYYIDFSDKEKLLLKETSLYLAMSIFSIMVIIIIFMVTYWNLREEKRLSDLKTDFINNMTHELKTPLSTITVAGKTLELEKIRNNDEKIVETARLIGKQSILLNQLINMILEISMWERTQFQLEKKTFDLEEVMNDIVESFRAGCVNCASISTNYRFMGAKADIDIVYFTTMINNLLSNAVKYSEKPAEITVGGIVSANKASVSIADNGIGINRNDQKHIFDKFYRASTGNIHKFKGLGLGLYYVKKIAEAHGGEVAVRSRPGRGSIFTITLPLK